MGKPVEVRVLSRALRALPYVQSGGHTNATVKKGYFAAFLLAAQRAFISSESFLLPAGVSAPFFLTGAAFLPADFLRAAQRAFISWESFLRPAGVSWPFFFVVGAGAVAAGPLSLAQRALAAAASFARVEGAK